MLAAPDEGIRSGHMPAYSIHPTAIVDPSCELSMGVEVGPYCVLRGQVRLHAGVRLIGHVHVEGPLEIGTRTTLYPGVCIGFPPQDYKFKQGMATAGVKIGSDCLIREHVTIHAASKAPGEGHPTTVGDRCFMMVASHMGHDARIGNDVVLVNNVLLAGHTEVMDKATLSGHAGVHQFCRIGRFAFVSGLSAIARDVPPFVIASERNTMNGINAVGLRRNGFSREHIKAIRDAFKEAFRTPRPRPEQIAVLREMGRDCPPVMEMAEFVAASKRGIVQASRLGINEEELA
ncbi:UDP-N-acetylglucosamine acyltransferase [Phycisphaerales bacterium]|nr:UDP-N-acetylglucosamine acyltransferase [Phycisphaerales bacterium]